jgi:hypothetical protein
MSFWAQLQPPYLALLPCGMASRPRDHRFQRLVSRSSPGLKTAPDFSPVVPVVPRPRWTRTRRNGAVIGGLSNVRYRLNCPPMSASGQQAASLSLFEVKEIANSNSPFIC